MCMKQRQMVDYFIKRAELQNVSLAAILNCMLENRL